MNWEMIGAVGELLGAVVVVASIIYLASEVRHNTAVARSEVGRDRTIAAANWLLAVSTDARLPALWAKTIYGRIPRSGLDPEDVIRMSFTYMSMLRIMESAFHSWQEGILTDKAMRTVVTPASAAWDAPFVADSWPLWKRQVPPDFAEYLESVIPQLRGLNEEDQA